MPSLDGCGGVELDVVIEMLQVTILTKAWQNTVAPEDPGDPGARPGDVLDEIGASQEALLTTIVPCIIGWTVQWYVTLPAVVKTWLQCSP